MVSPRLCSRPPKASSQRLGGYPALPCPSCPLRKLTALTLCVMLIGADPVARSVLPTNMLVAKAGGAS